MPKAERWLRVLVEDLRAVAGTHLALVRNRDGYQVHRRHPPLSSLVRRESRLQGLELGALGWSAVCSAVCSLQRAVSCYMYERADGSALIRQSLVAR